MAVSKLWAVNSRLGQVIDYAANPEKTAADIYSEEQYQALADVLSYAKDEEKTEREYFVEGINCNPTTARDQFVSVKLSSWRWALALPCGAWSICWRATARITQRPKARASST